jgi:hypothetical protein
MTKTGEVNFGDSVGNQWLAESWQNEAGEVSTTYQLLEPADPSLDPQPTEPVWG